MSPCHWLTEAYVFFYGSEKPIDLVMVNTITSIRTVSLSHSVLMLPVINVTLNSEREAKDLTVSI